jgi:hypothetical protein
MNRKLLVAAALVLIGLFVNACGEAVSLDGAVPNVPGDGGTNSLMLSWTAPTTNEDGSPLEDLAGYRIYYGNESGNYSYVVDLGDYTTVEIDNLSNKTWYVTVTAYDYFGNESDYSNEISYTFY